MTRPPVRASRLLGWTLGSVVAAAVLGLLLVAGVTIWYFQVSAPNRQRAITEAEREMSRKAAAEAQGALASAAGDGSLTDDEIRKAVGGPVWDVRRADAAWFIRAKFEGTEPLCFSYEVTLPLGPATRVTGTELAECPVIRPVG